MALFTSLADPEFAQAAGMVDDEPTPGQDLAGRADREKAAQLFD